jgi:hypothetical protein
LIDMSPSLGALNQNMVSISDLLIVPTSPDFFSIMALQSLARVLPRWSRWAHSAASNEVLGEASYPYPKPRLRLAGIVIQRYRLYRSPTEDEPYGTPTGPFQAWIEKVAEASETIFAPALNGSGLTFDRSDYEDADIPPNLILAQIQEFNSLLPKSQDFHVPVYELTDEQLGQGGIVLQASRTQIDSLHRIFSTMADRILHLASDAE